AILERSGLVDIHPHRRGVALPYEDRLPLVIGPRLLAFGAEGGGLLGVGFLAHIDFGPDIGLEWPIDRRGVLAGLAEGHDVVSKPLPANRAVLEDLRVQQPDRLRALLSNYRVLPDADLGVEDPASVLISPHYL